MPVRPLFAAVVIVFPTTRSTSFSVDRSYVLQDIVCCPLESRPRLHLQIIVNITELVKKMFILSCSPNLPVKKKCFCFCFFFCLFFSLFLFIFFFSLFLSLFFPLILRVWLVLFCSHARYAGCDCLVWFALPHSL